MKLRVETVSCLLENYEGLENGVTVLRSPLPLTYLPQLPCGFRIAP